MASAQRVIVRYNKHIPEAEAVRGDFRSVDGWAIDYNSSGQVTVSKGKNGKLVFPPDKVLCIYPIWPPIGL